MSRTGRQGSIAIKKESSYGTYIAGDIFLRATTESLALKLEHTEDAALINEIYTTDLIKTGQTVDGSVEMSMHGDTTGYMLLGVLGGENTAVSDAATDYILISYNGASPYARLTKSTNTLTAELSTAGSSWVADTNFNTTGSIDLTNASFDTLAELATAITAYTGWDAVVFGAGTSSSATIADFAATNLKAASVKVGGLLVNTAITSSTTAKKHTLFPAASGSNLPSFSYTINRVLGTNQSIGITGVKNNAVTINNANKDLCKLSIAVVAKTEETAKTDIALTYPLVQAYTASKMKIVYESSTGAQTVLDEVKDITLTINANLDDNYVVGSETKLEPDRQGATIEVAFNANNTSDQYGIRTNFTGDLSGSLYIYWLGVSNADSTNSIPYNIMCRIPDFKFKDFNSTLSTPDRLVIAASGQVIKAKNATYSKHIYFYVTDNLTAVY